MNYKLWRLSHFVLYIVSILILYKLFCFIQTVLFYNCFVFTVCSVFFRSSYKVLLSHAIGNLLRQNSLRIRKSTLYFFLTCLERAHSRLNTRASRTAISTPFNVFQYSYPSSVPPLSIQFRITYLLRSHIVLDISFFLTYISLKMRVARQQTC